MAVEASSKPEAGVQTVIDSPSNMQLVIASEQPTPFIKIKEVTELTQPTETKFETSSISQNETSSTEQALYLAIESTVANENKEQESSAVENRSQDELNDRLNCPAQCECIKQTDRTSYNCSLPSGVVTITEYGDGIFFQCLNGVLRCSEIPERGRRVGAGALGVGALLRSVMLRGCALADEPLACMLRRRGAAGAARLTLQAPRVRLAAAHVRGLRELSMLRLTDLDEQEMELPLQAMSVLPELKHFTLNNGRLSLKEALPPLPLEALELADDELQSLPTAAFQHLSSLRRLGLWRNRFTELPDDTLQGLEQLQQLSLSSNELRSLPAGLLAHTPHLKQLDLYDNALETLPRTVLAGLKHLEQVRLYDNRGLLSLGNGTFASLQALRDLDLSRAGARVMPPDLLQGSHALERLAVAGNALREVPNELLRGLAALSYLDLSRNLLSRLPNAFFADQRNLTDLYLDRNLFETLPGSMFVGLSELKVLSLDHNRLRYIESDAFVGLRALRELRLAHNQLALAPPDTISGHGYGLLAEPPSPFNSLFLLTHLDLSHNRVQQLLDDWRNVLVSLQKLNLSWNNITDLNYINMNFLSSDVVVDLRHNNISTVKLWGPSDGNAQFLLDDNPFMCDCHLPALQRALLAGAVGSGPRLVATRARCAAPPALNGMNLVSVPHSLLECALPPPICPPACSCSLRTDFLDLDCTALPTLAALPAPAAHGLAVAHLRLRRVPESLESLPRYFRLLNLTALNITEVPPLPPDVEVDLIDNRLTRVPTALLTNNTLRLALNPLSCDCGGTVDVVALQRASLNILDYGDVTCSNGETLRSIATETLCEARDAAVLGVSLAILIVIAVIIVVLLRRYRTECLLCAHRCGCCPPDDDDDEKEYDAFISFAHKDLKFAEEMVTKLEASPHSLRICVHYRDWPLGDWIPAQISRSVERSRRTVVILSKHFLSSVWGLLEFREAHLRALSEGHARVVIVLLDDVMSDERLNDELRAYLSTNTYLHRDDPWFWAKLADALRRRGGVAAAMRRFAKSRARAAPAPPLPVDKLVRSALDAKLMQNGNIINAAFTAPSL
ncbi:unnamed protein product [Parnassius apollo]|uniref:(apollo) hypothetical protein n=1 Tax=Parnassius apollo TaxID=110799 RepID=A0A8S3YBP0_PARAO|nr:unnamed protein product [Parnassius apollo]